MNSRTVPDRPVDDLRARLATLQGELAAARKRLHDSLAGVAHDLGQPLTTLHGGLELALRSSATTPSARQVLVAALQETQSAMRLVRLVGELAEAEVSGEAARATSVKHLLADLREDLETLALSRGVRLALPAESPGVVLAHPPDLRRAIFYLVEHAVDYSPADGLVGFTVIQETSTASMMITHQGPAISPEDLPQWFEPFYSGHRGSAKQHQGLRLAIAQRTCESCWGSLTAVNLSPQGVRFILQLPLA